MASSTSGHHELDYLAFLSPSFDSREYAQALLNGTSSSSSNILGAPAGVGDDVLNGDSAIDPRTLEALQQLGLASTSKSSALPSSSNAPNGLVSGKAAANPSLGSFMGRSASGSGDISAALSKLSFSVDDLNRQLRSEINTHHSALLVQAGSVSALEDALRQIRGGLDEVESAGDRLRRKIAAPHATLAASLTRLAKLQRASDLARKASRFTTLARRLDLQMAELNAVSAKATSPVNGKSKDVQATSSAAGSADGGERALSEAALTLAELDVLLAEEAPTQEGEEPRPGIRAITAVESHVAAVEANRTRVIDEMEVMIRRGLQELNQSLLASSLQTAYNLSVLPALVASLVGDLIDAIESRIRTAFDVAALARDALSRAGEALPASGTSGTSSMFYKSRARTEPTNANLPHFQAALWSRLESVIEDMAGCCIKVHVLERVLKLKKDPLLNSTFLDDALSVLDNKPTFTFWTTLSTAFETHAREAARASSFVQQTLGTSYPRLLRLFHEFFSKIALQSDTIYAQNQQSPETVLILRSISSFESLYLSRCTNRMNEAVASAFSGDGFVHSVRGTRAPPSSQEGMTAARVLSNELDVSRFDPLLVKNVAKQVGKAIDGFVDRAESMIATDYTATSLAGPSATGSQSINAELATALYHFWGPLHRVIVSYPPNIQDLLRAPIATVRQTLANITTPLLNAIRRELSSITARIHRTGFSKPMDPTSISVYMQDLNDKINYIRRHILAPLRVGELMKEWVTEIGKFILQRFVLHASIAHPLGEGGKLKLTTDLTTLEFAVSQMLSDCKLNLNALGDNFKALRSFRPLLFLETSSLSSAKQTQDIPNLILIHHLIVRCHPYVRLPYLIHGWSEAEYVKYITEHSNAESRRLLEGSLKEWEAKKSDEGGEEVKIGLEQLREVFEREKARDASRA